MRWKLMWMGLILFVLAVVDLYQPIFGRFWYLLWIATAVVFVLWFYYAFVVRRAGLFILPQYFLLRGSLYSARISYGRINAITSTQLSQHFELKDLKARERRLVKPLRNHTCGFVGLNSFPKSLKRRHLWFPRSLFGTRRPGLLLIVPDWMKLSRDLEVARQRWREVRGLSQQEDTRSLAARILDY